MNNIFTFYDPPPDPLYTPSLDGVSHINTYSKSRTRLGRMLSNFYHSPFIFEPYGKFQSGEGFWYWYLTGMQHDELKNLYGYEAKKVGKTFHKTVEWNSSVEEVFKHMLVEKICQNNEIKELLSKSTLPLVHYYVYGDKVIPVDCEWMMTHMENIRNILKE